MTAATFVTNVVAIVLVVFLSLAHGDDQFHLRASSMPRLLPSPDHRDVVPKLLVQTSINDPMSDEPKNVVVNNSMKTTKKKSINATITVLRTATLLHGLNKTLAVGDPSDTFVECYLTSYNEAAIQYHGPVLDNMTEDAQFVVDTTSSSSSTTLNDDEIVSYVVSTTPKPATNKPSTVLVYVGKGTTGSQCNFCGDDRLREEAGLMEEEEHVGGSGGETPSLETSKRHHEQQQQRRELVYAAFEKDFYHCLKNSGQPSFDQLVKLQVHQLQLVVTSSNDAVVRAVETNVVPQGNNVLLDQKVDA
jgi:hypothetical protein